LTVAFRLSPNIELLFTEAGPRPADRVRAAAAAGFDAVELWGTLHKDVPALAQACADSGVSVTCIAAEPRTNLALPGEDLSEFWMGLERSVENARLLGSPWLILGSGVGYPAVGRTWNHQRLVEILRKAVDRTRGSGVGLVLEAVNTRVDHPGMLIDHTCDAVSIARAVDDPTFGILYDTYHSATQGEDVGRTIADAGDLIRYVQIADAPGRGEPETGGIDWANVLSTLIAVGYTGPIGLEYYPKSETRLSVRAIHREVERLAEGGPQ
jgi:hydroxypyruvate isomerase